MNKEQKIEKLKKELKLNKVMWDRALERDDEGELNYLEREWELICDELRRLEGETR